MERWQKIERCLSEFFRSGGFEVHQPCDIVAIKDDDCEINLTALAKEIDSEIGK